MEKELIVGVEKATYENNGKWVEYNKYYIKVGVEKLYLKLTDGQLAKTILNRTLGIKNNDE